MNYEKPYLLEEWFDHFHSQKFPDNMHRAPSSAELMIQKIHSKEEAIKFLVTMLSNSTNFYNHYI